MVEKSLPLQGTCTNLKRYPTMRSNFFSIYFNFFLFLFFSLGQYEGGILDPQNESGCYLKSSADTFYQLCLCLGLGFLFKVLGWRLSTAKYFWTSASAAYNYFFVYLPNLDAILSSLLSLSFVIFSTNFKFPFCSFTHLITAFDCALTRATP